MVPGEEERQTRQEGKAAVHEIAVGQAPSDRLSRTSLVQRHRAHLQAQEENPHAVRPVRQVVLSEAYPASARSIRDLEVIPLCALKVETHHRGQGIIVQAVTPPYRGVGCVSIVVDAQGHADQLAIYNHGDTSILANLPAGCIVAVKEPYYKCHGPRDYMVCVDHPSDVVLLRFGDPVVPKALLSSHPAAVAALRRTPEAWQEAGDAAFVQGDYPAAAFCYTEALDSAHDPPTINTADEPSGDDPPTRRHQLFRAGVYAKRAGTNLLLGRYDAAHDDALRSRTDGPGDWRAYSLAAKAAYGLRRYPASQRLFEQALAGVSGEEEGGDTAAAADARLHVQREYERCLARVREETCGEEAYDFRALHAQLGPQHMHLDGASFVRRTAVRDSPLHGHGLFAAEAIRAGEIVFVEKATCMPNQYDEPAPAAAALHAAMVRHMYDNPTVAAAVQQQLYGGDELARTGREGCVVESDGRPVVDVFRAESIRQKNGFSAPLSTREATRPASRGTAHHHRRQAQGLFRHASHLNHSCVPNTMRSFLGDLLVSRAVRDIAAGEELCQQYVPVQADWPARQAQLRAGWGFACACPLCAAEARSPPARRDRRRAVLLAAEQAVARHQPHQGPPDAVVQTVERLVQQLEALHDDDDGDGDGGEDVYGPGRPRLTLVYPTMWLLRAHRGRRQHAQVLVYAAKTLQCFGFATPTGDDDAAAGSTAAATATPKNSTGPRHGPPGSSLFARGSGATLHTIHVVSALKYGAEAHRALGQEADAKAWEEAAQFGYRIITGFEDSLDAIDEGDTPW